MILLQRLESKEGKIVREGRSENDTIERGRSVRARLEADCDEFEMMNAPTASTSYLNEVRGTTNSYLLTILNVGMMQQWSDDVFP